MMEHLTLPQSRLTISRVALGGCPLGGHGWGQVDDGEAISAVRRAFDLGINFFDTADVYGLGRSEELLSLALGNDRHRVVIATKFGVRRTVDGRTVKDISPGYLRKALEASLRRLRVECIPLYYVHWPDGQTPVEDAVVELDRCRAEGKIHAIGVSNFSAEQLQRACRTAAISAAQVQYSLVDRELAESLRQATKDCGVPLITWGSLAQGLLTGKYVDASSFGTNDRRSRYDNFQGDKLARNVCVVVQLQAMARRLGKSSSQLALRWLLESPQVGCVLFGAKRPSQVEDNVGAVGWRLSADDYESLQVMNPERALLAA